MCRLPVVSDGMLGQMITLLSVRVLVHSFLCQLLEDLLLCKCHLFQQKFMLLLDSYFLPMCR